MSLPALPPDPEPTAEDLAPFMAEWPIAEGKFVVGADELRAMGAQISWRLARQKRDPNSFLVPFVGFLGTLLPKFDYAAYLRSPLWQEIRTKVLTSAGHRCVGCDSKANQVHHRDYRPRVLSGDDLTPLVALCAKCHDAVEDARKGEGWNAGERVLAELVDQARA